MEKGEREDVIMRGVKGLENTKRRGNRWLGVVGWEARV